jgi:hypothetical protein
MGAILYSLLHPWKVVLALLVWELKLHIPFLCINDSTCSSQKGLPRIIGLWTLLFISIIINSTGIQLICNSTSTLWTLLREWLVEESASNKSTLHFLIRGKSRWSNKDLGIAKILDPRSSIADEVIFPLYYANIWEHFEKSFISDPTFLNHFL